MGYKAMKHNTRGELMRLRCAHKDMLRRCYDPKSCNYKNYGGRGISVCDRWRESIINFIIDVGRPPPGLSIDRINNDGDYEPGNIRWATRSEQQFNRRKRIYSSETACRHGHPYTEDNIYRVGNKTKCLTCRRAIVNTYNRRKRARAPIAEEVRAGATS